MPADIHFEAITLPGFADRPRDPTLKSMRDYARQLQNMIDRIHLGNAPLVLLGTGIGGSFCLEYIQHYQANGLILHAPVGTRLDTRFFPRLMRLPGMPGLGKWVFSSRLTRPLFRRRLFVDHKRIPPQYLTRFFNEYRRCSVFGQMFSIINTAWWAGLNETPIPAALLWGEKERVLTVDQLEDYKALLPNHIVHTEPGWDHFPMIEQPAEYARVTSELALRLITQ